MNKVLYLLAILLVSLPLQHLQAAESLAKNNMELVSFTVKAPDALRSMIKSALDHHPRMQASRAAMQASLKQLKAAQQAVYNPELELDTERTGVDSSYLQLSQTIDLGDLRGSLTSVAQAGLVKAKADFELAVLQLQYDLVSSYIERDIQSELSRLSEQTLGLMSEFVNIAELRHKSGDLSQVELDLARLAHSESIISHASALTELVTAREKLNAIFISPPVNISALRDKFPQASLPNDLEKFLHTLPEVRANVAEISIARHTVDLRRSKKRVNPTIALRGGRDGSDSLVGITLSIPLNVRNTYSAEIEVAQQRLIERQQLAQQAFREQRSKVLASTQRLQLLRKAWLAWKKTGQSSVTRQLISIKRLWRAGDMSTSEYLVQLKQTLDTQVAGVELQNKLWKSSLDWMLATASIDDWLNLTTESN